MFFLVFWNNNKESRRKEDMRIMWENIISEQTAWGETIWDATSECIPLRGRAYAWLDLNGSEFELIGLKIILKD